MVGGHSPYHAGPGGLGNCGILALEDHTHLGGAREGDSSDAGSADIGQVYRKASGEGI